MHDDSIEHKRGRVLVVDDALDYLNLLHGLLTQTGFEVTAVQSGILALDIAQAVDPEIILLNVCMPEMDGYEVCRRLKADGSTQSIPVIFVSVLDDVTAKVKAFEAGGVDYITKPFQMNEVVVRLKTHLASYRLLQQLKSQNARLRQEVYDRLATEIMLQTANQGLQRLAHIDELTQVANRRSFNKALTHEWRRLAREQQPLSLIFCDVDCFKIYNDTYGHQAGDECLRQIASTISTTLRRPGDSISRYGGEEFAVILPNTPIAGAVHVASAIQIAIRALDLVHAGSCVSQVVTLSLGVSTVAPIAELSPMTLVAAADRALYRAKLEGRDRVCVERVCGENVWD